MKITALLQVAALQLQCSTNIDNNRLALKQQITAVAESGAKLVVLQELHNAPYPCQIESTDYFDQAEPIPGPSCDWFATLAKQLQVVIVTSLFEKRAAGLYHNTAVVFETTGEIAGLYRKMHIPDDPGYYEKFYFTPGDLGFQPIQTSVATLGVCVCWDQWFPEAARLMALAGADLLIYPTAIGWDQHDSASEQQRQLDAWRTIQQSHAIANGIPVICCNRVGFEPHPNDAGQGTLFWGNSFIAGPQGELLASAEQTPTTLTATLDLNHSEAVRQQWPFLRDRRIDHYAGLTKLCRDYHKKAHD